MSDHSHPENRTRRRFMTAVGAGVAGLALGSQASAQPGSPNRRDCRRYENAVVLITGATSGIGEAAAHGYAREGAKVFFCGRREDRGQQVEQAIRAAGGEATYMRADVREEEQMKALVARCLDTYGRLDIAFNNAGITGHIGGLDTVSVSGDGYYHDVMRTNVDGVLYAMRHELPVMRAQGSGVIVNTGSLLSHRGSPQMAAYAASKHAVIGLTRSAAAAEAGNGIRVVSVSPGGTRTDIMKPYLPEGATQSGAGTDTPMGRIAEPDEIASVVLSVTDPACLFLNGDDVRADGAVLA